MPCALSHGGRIGSAIILAVLATVATLVAFQLINNPQTFAVVHARSEYLEYKVFNPELAVLHGSGLRISSWPDGSRDDQCAGGIIKPGVLATVSYQRVEQGDLQITVTGKGSFLTDGSGSGTFDGEAILYPDPICGKLVTKRFPVWGPGKIGSSFAMRGDGPGPILLSGTLEVFGRTIGLGPFGSGGAIYVATPQPLTIPPAGFIESDQIGNAAPSSRIPPEITALFGYISLSDEAGFDVQITTETPFLQVSTPGVRQNANRIEIGLFA